MSCMCVFIRWAENEEDWWINQADRWGLLLESQWVVITLRGALYSKLSSLALLSICVFVRCLFNHRERSIHQFSPLNNPFIQSSIHLILHQSMNPSVVPSVLYPLVHLSIHRVNLCSFWTGQKLDFGCMTGKSLMQVDLKVGWDEVWRAGEQRPWQSGGAGRGQTGKALHEARRQRSREDNEPEAWVNTVRQDLGKHDTILSRACFSTHALVKWTIWLLPSFFSFIFHHPSLPSLYLTGEFFCAIMSCACFIENCGIFVSLNTLFVLLRQTLETQNSRNDFLTRYSLLCLHRCNIYLAAACSRPQFIR